MVDSLEAAPLEGQSVGELLALTRQSNTPADEAEDIAR